MWCIQQKENLFFESTKASTITPWKGKSDTDWKKTVICDWIKRATEIWKYDNGPFPL